MANAMEELQKAAERLQECKGRRQEAIVEEARAVTKRLNCDEDYQTAERLFSKAVKVIREGKEQKA